MTTTGSHYAFTPAVDSSKPPRKEHAQSFLSCDARCFQVSPFKRSSPGGTPRRPPTKFITEHRVIGVTGIDDDFYTEIICWASTNIIAIALQSQIFLFNYETSCHYELVDARNPRNSYSISSLAWSPKVRGTGRPFTS